MTSMGYVMMNWSSELIKQTNKRKRVEMRKRKREEDEKEVEEEQQKADQEAELKRVLVEQKGEIRLI